MIYLGLDISTSCIGMALLNENKELLKETCLRLDKAPYKTYSFYEKLEAFRGFLLEFVEGCKVDCVVVEQALGGHVRSSAQIIQKLARFNGACRFIVFSELGIIPEEIHPSTIKARVKLKVPKGGCKKTETLKLITELYPQFTYGLTRSGNPEKGSDDRADAIMAALGFIILQENSK